MPISSKRNRGSVSVANAGRAARADNPQGVADRAVIDAALAGDTTAWDKLYHQCHGPLLASARAILGPRNADLNQIEELAARVWYSLVRNGGELLARFDPARGCRLTTFLSNLARDHASRMFRSERRRRRREAISCDLLLRNGRSGHEAADGASIEMSEFESTLTPKEREFYREIVATNDPSPTAPKSEQPARSDANRWQLQLRVRRKLEKFLKN
jgi:hypothetical protein